MYVKISRECENCQLLRELLEEERTNNRRLMDKILNPPQEVREPEPEHVMAPIKPTSWRVRRNLLEQEDRKKAELEKKKKDEIANSKIAVEREQTIEELEKELGVEDAGNIQ